MDQPHISVSLQELGRLWEALQSWRIAQCDGEWEHEFGIKIETIENPGWGIKIDLTGTELEYRQFDAIDDGYNDDDNYDERGKTLGPWLWCYVKDKQFVGICDAHQLPRMVIIFIRWTKECTRS